MSKARIAQKTVYFTSDIKKVWDIVTNNSDYAWRSDIKSVEILSDGNEWLEYYDNGKFTKFILKKKINIMNMFLKWKTLCLQEFGQVILMNLNLEEQKQYLLKIFL